MERVSASSSTQVLHTTYSHAAVHTGHVLPVVDIYVAVVENEGSIVPGGGRLISEHKLLVHVVGELNCHLCT